MTDRLKCWEGLSATFREIHAGQSIIALQADAMSVQGFFRIAPGLVNFVRG